MDKRRSRGLYERYLKRAFDIVLSLSFLVLFWWLFLVLALCVRAKLGSPVLFKQDRPGKSGVLFKLCKFRSMTDARDESGNLKPDAERMPPFGRLLRSTSLDELPELFNILKGDMSFVGPRPLVPEYLPYYTEEESRRHDVRPGLTGLAQVNGRTAINWDLRFKYDIEYVDNITFLGDMKIILQTFQKVIARADVVAAEDQGSFDEYRQRQLAGE